MERAFVCLLLPLLLPRAAPAPCPRPCSCPRPTELHCTFRSLLSVPADVPRHAERINLGFNSISEIKDRTLSGLRRLELLMIHGNHLQAVADGAFRDLDSLQMLKISYNKLKEISRRTLHGLWSLVRLHLDHNQLEFIHPDAFQGLTSLRLLQLEGNRLQQLHPATFVTFGVLAHFHVSTLRHLYLSDNGLLSLPSGLLETMPKLENLYLHGNPWSCDCNMRWLPDWDKASPGVLKCKKDPALPGGKLCPMCSSPRHLNSTELQAVENLACSGPAISFPHRTAPVEDDASEMLTSEDLREPMGNITLGLSDEHGNEVDLRCSISDSKELQKIDWEQVNQHQLLANITFSVELQCPVDREKYERLWRLVAYYSSVPASLKRRVLLTKIPHPTYAYEQDSVQNAQYYTGVKVNMTARPSWLMQPSVDLRLNRPQSSAKIVKLILGMDISKTMEAELEQRQRRMWVLIESTNRTRKVQSALLGGPSEMHCSVRGSDQPVIRWMLPDGSKLNTTYSSPDSRVSASRDGRLMIKAVHHRDAGIYHCISRVRGDVAVLPFYLTVQDSSSPPPGEDETIASIEKLAGNPVSLDCTASGSPDPEINWILPSGEVVGIHAKSSKVLLHSNGTLYIPQIQSSGSGYYKCVAVNQHGVDTQVKKIVVLKSKGLVRSLKKLTKGPQSASGVSTQIKVPTADPDEASGDTEVTQVTQDGAPTRRSDVRRRISGGGASGTRGVFPSRSTWRRPTVLRKPTGPHGENRKIPAVNRRRIHVSKPKIDPEKWANILGKIRDRSSQNSVTPFPVEPTTREATEETPKQPSEREKQHEVTEQTPKKHTRNKKRKNKTHSQYTNNTHVTIKHQLTNSMQHTTHDGRLDLHTTSHSVFTLPGTTSVPLHPITFWQANMVSPQLNPGTNQDLNGDEIPELSVTPKNPATSREDKGSPFDETPTPSQLHPQPTDMTTVPTSTTKTGSEKNPSALKPGTRKRNGGRKGRPKRRKHKLKTSTNTPGNTPPPTVETSASTELKIKTTVSFTTAVPFTESQAASSGGLGHEDRTASWRDHEAGTKPTPLPASLSEMNEIHLSSAKPSGPTGSPDTTRGSTTSLPGILTLIPQPKLTDGPPPLDKPSENTQKPATELEPLLYSDNSIRGFQTATWLTTDVENNPSTGQLGLLQKEGREARLSPSFTSTTSFMEPGTGTTSSSIGSNTTSSVLSEQDSEAEDVTTMMAKSLDHGSGQHEIPGIESKLDQSLKVNQNRSVDALTTSELQPTPSTAASSTPLTVTLPVLVLHVTKPNMSSHRPTTQSPWITVNQGQDQTTLQPTTESPSQKLLNTNPTLQDLKLPIYQTSTSIPTRTEVQSKPPRQTPSTFIQDASTELPQQGSVVRGKPKITKNSFQTVSVKAGTDAQLPCEVESQTMPFLSWTKVATGASIALNMRTRRLEVHPNGTLMIRKSQLTDSGQYLCTVQNEYGTDRMMGNLLVLPQPPRVLEPRSRDVAVDLGDQVELECKVEGHPVPQVTWVLPSHVQISAALMGVDPQRRVTVDNEGTLRIRQSSFTDTGTYRCIGSSAAGSDAVSVRLYISVLPPVIQQTQHENMTYLEGSPVYIHCTAAGTPKPIIHWITPDGIQLTASQTVNGQNFIVFPNGTLHIRRLGPRNSGKYECSTGSSVSSSRRIVSLIVGRNLLSAKATIVSSSPQKTDVMYGKKLLLNCVATGEPEPRILWRTPSKKLADAQYSFDPRIKVFLNGSITIHPVAEKDAGDYLCVARNKMGDDYVQLRVNVMTRPAKIESKYHRSSQEVVHGEDLKVDCVASGLPNPEISWALPDGTMVNPVKQRGGIGAGRSRRYVVFDNGTLYFNDVGMPEEGDYTCYAENQLGKDEMKVRVRVKTALSPPQIQDKDQNIVRVLYGQTVTLQCSAKGDPLPTITWISPANSLISPVVDKYHILKDGTLLVQKVQHFDGGNYTCMAKNNAGQDHKVTRLEVLVTPPVINDLRGATNTVKVTAVQGQRRLLDCMARGTPTPRIIWILPGNRILPAPYYSNGMTVHQNGTLEIGSPKKTDSGQLTCVARNEGGEVRLLVNLDIKETVERPQILDPKTDTLSLRIGNTMTLNCSFEGLKLPHPTWILSDGTPLHAGARYSKFFHQLDGSLVISNPTVADAGLYRCLGHNSAGLMERTVRLSPGRKPEIQNRYSSPVSITNGETLFLHCQTSGEMLRLTWTLPSGVVLNRLQRAGRYTIMPNGTLAIRQVSVYDRGSYICRAANEYGSSQLSASVILITHPPRITISPPSVTYVKRGVAVQLNCAATGIPKAEVAWETPDKTHLAVSAQARLFGNKYVLPQGSLIIQSPTRRDAGVYRCTAKNAFGIDSKTTILNVFQ